MNYEVVIGPGPARVSHFAPVRQIHLDAFLAHRNDCRVCNSAADDGRHRDCPEGARLRAKALEEQEWLR